VDNLCTVSALIPALWITGAQAGAIVDNLWKTRGFSTGTVPPHGKNRQKRAATTPAATLQISIKAKITNSYGAKSMFLH
jgi:hypothetical protein